MNFINKCTSNEIELIKKAGIELEDKDYSKEELKKCQLQIVEYIYHIAQKMEILIN